MDFASSCCRTVHVLVMPSGDIDCCWLSYGWTTQLRRRSPWALFATAAWGVGSWVATFTRHPLTRCAVLCLVGRW
jgi:hypothetical protein